VSVNRLSLNTALTNHHPEIEGDYKHSMTFIISAHKERGGEGGEKREGGGVYLLPEGLYFPILVRLVMVTGYKLGFGWTLSSAQLLW